MVRYHISDKVGVAPCNAKENPGPGERGCQFGVSTIHYATREEADKVFQAQMEEEHGSTATIIPTNDDSFKKKYLESVIIPPITGKYADYQESGMLEGLSEKEKEYFETLYKGEIPDMMPSGLSDSSVMRGYFMISQDAGSYANVTRMFSESVRDALPEGAVVLDPMAGRGFLAKGLREAGVPTIASDDNSWNLSESIERMDALSSLDEYGDKITHLAISWAPYGSTIDAELGEKISKDYPHVKVLYIGEDEGGCTGSEAFWDYYEGESYINSYQSHSFLNDFASVGSIKVSDN